MMVFHLQAVLDVSAAAPDADLHQAADVLMEHLHAVSNQDGRLDCTVGVERETTATGRIEVDLDVAAHQVDDAFPLALTWLRGALHAAGVPTPGWTVGRVVVDQGDPIDLTENLMRA